MAPDEELLGLVKSFSAERRVPKPVRIERLPVEQRFRARIGARGRPFEHASDSIPFMRSAPRSPSASRG